MLRLCKILNKSGATVVACQRSRRPCGLCRQRSGFDCHLGQQWCLQTATIVAICSTVHKHLRKIAWSCQDSSRQTTVPIVTVTAALKSVIFFGPVTLLHVAHRHSNTLFQNVLTCVRLINATTSRLYSPLKSFIISAISSTNHQVRPPQRTLVWNNVQHHPGEGIKQERKWLVELFYIINGWDDRTVNTANDIAIDFDNNSPCVKLMLLVRSNGHF